MILDFWCPTENMERLPHRQVSLYKFVRLAGDLLMPSLYTPYVKLLGKKVKRKIVAYILHCKKIREIAA